MDRLGVLDQFNLLVGKRPHFLPVNDYRADQTAFLEHWDSNLGSCASQPRCHARTSRGSVIGSVAHLFCEHDTFELTTGYGLKGPPLLVELSVFLWRADISREVKSSPIETIQDAKFGLADTHSVFQHGLEYRFELARRRADNAQYICCGSLLLEWVARLRHRSGEAGVQLHARRQAKAARPVEAINDKALALPPLDLALAPRSQCM
jgi:hypothetical protein